MTPIKQTAWKRLQQAWRQRRPPLGDVGQTAIVAVATIALIASLSGAILVSEVTTASHAQQGTSVTLSAANALTAGEQAYIVALNANPSLATCTSNDANGGTCTGLQYGVWDPVSGSGPSTGSDMEYYAFGNPQPTFDPSTNALVKLTVEVAGAAADPSEKNGYLFDQELFTITPSNGFLKNVWWSNYESYSTNGDYTSCNYNWSSASSPPATDFSTPSYYKPGMNYNIDGLNNNGKVGCQPVYFDNGDYLFGPAFSNDSMYVYTTGGIDFGSPTSGSAVTTADPNCLFVDDGTNSGMNGSYSNCKAANGQVSQYAPQANSQDCTVQGTNTSYCDAGYEQPPTTDQSLKQIAELDGCLYRGPTQIQIHGDQMTVSAQDGTEQVAASNHNTCPTSGTTSIPSNGVVYVDNDSSDNGVVGANPLDGLIYNSATNVTASSTTANVKTTFTATVTSGSASLASGTNVSFSYTTSSGTTTPCASVALSNATPVGSNYAATATCTATPTKTITAYKAVTTTTGTAITGSTGQNGQTNNYTANPSYGPDSQISGKTPLGTGSCVPSGTNPLVPCYYGQTGNPDTEGDAFVSGDLSGQLTIGTANNVVVDGNITYDDCTSSGPGNWSLGQSGSSKAQLGLCKFNLDSTPNDSLGLIANNYVEVGHPIDQNDNVLAACVTGSPAALCNPSGTDAACTSGTHGLTIDAAILALNQSFVVNNYNSGNGEGCLTVYGSVQQFARGPVGNTGGAGYTKQYTWDPMLDYVSPPSYLVPSTPSWVFQGTEQTSGGNANNICPVLTGIVSSINWTTGSSTPGTPITQSCSQGTGTLPNYPTNTAPTPPLNVQATQPGAGSTSVTVNWNAPTTLNGATLTGYTVTASQDGGTCTTAGTSCTVTGLTSGTTYSFNVVANTNLGPSNPSAPSNAVTIPGAPSSPTNVQATVNNDGSLQVAWSNALGHGLPVSSYTVTPSPPCAGCTYTYTAGSTTSSMKINGSAGGTTYTFTVTATNAMGTSAASAPSNPVTAPATPGAPTGVTATPGTAQATVSWTAPTSTSGLPITAYIVTPYKGGVAQTSQTFNTSATTDTVTGLTNGTAYTFTVAAKNVIGTGPASSPSAAVTPANVPGAPTIGTATANSDGTVTVTWSAPTNNGGSAVTGYVVTPYLNGTSAQTSQTFGSTATSDVVNGLNPSSSYKFKVAAINVIGTGAQSANSGSVTTASVPKAPTGVTGTRGDGSVALRWTAPTSSGSTPINGYIITPYVGGVAQTPVSTGSSATSYTVTGLANGTAYTFTVAATNAAGAGAQSAASSAITPATTPGLPTGVAAAANANGSVTVTWTAPSDNGGAAVTGYTVTPYLGNTALTPKAFATTATSQTLSGLTGGQAYTFTVAATNGIGTGSPSSASNSVTPPSAPGAPTGVTATSGNGQVSVSWTAPSDDGGSPVTGYAVTPYVGVNAQTTQTFNSTATSQTISGLANGTSYTFEVAAINAVGPGTQSSPSAGVTPMTVPGIPTGVSATRGNAQVSLSWTAAGNGGSPISSYVVIPYIGGTAQTAISTGSSATSYTVTGLTNGTAYTFTVAATNGVGTGSASGKTGSVTPATTPDPPTGVTATAGTGSASVSWTAPGNNGGSAITGYVVTPYIGLTAQTAKTFNSTATTETVTGLANGTTYTFTVQATNAIGNGAASAASSAVTPATVPGAPTAVTAVPGNASASVSWTPPTSTGGSPITGYVVTPYTGSTAKGAQTFNSTATTETVNGLSDGTAYTFKVAAINNIGTGASSAASSSITTPNVPGTPAKPTTTKSGTSVTVKWTAPSTSTGYPILNYVITPSSGSAVTVGNVLTYTFTGLSTSKSYTFTVAAVNAVGTGAESPASASTTG